MIRSFRCRDTQALFDDRDVRRFRNIERVARRKLLYLNRAIDLRDLRSPPGNRLEALRGDREGNIVSGSMTNGVSVFAGKMEMLLMLKSSTTTEDLDTWLS
jgi:plasmid maintenance system killer protein